MQEKELGLATLLLLNVLLFVVASQQMQTIGFYVQTSLVFFYLFQGGVFLITLLEKKPSTSIPGITFLVMFCNAFFITGTGYMIATVICSITGLIITTLKFYKKHLRKTIKKQDILDKELDDSWEKDPHVIYE
jgi:hypothetical protein